MNVSAYITHLLGLVATDDDGFDQLAEIAFGFQKENNRVYKQYCEALGVDAFTGWKEVPALPIAAFKEVPVVTFDINEAETTFQSSGTGRGKRSKHYVKSLDLYRQVALRGFSEAVWTQNVIITAHLPGYSHKKQSSSLVYMVDAIIQSYGKNGSGFYHENPLQIAQVAAHAEETDSAFVLIGATFGLIDLLEQHSWRLPARSLVIETGGMKTHRRQTDRNSLHSVLSEGFGVPREQIRSEYGMCEMLSQCYTFGGECFFPPPWLRVRIVDPENPAFELEDGQVGLVAVCDLANIHTVSAILTEDLGRKCADGFEVVGRMDNTDLRGCNYLMSLDG